ncbi:MAG: hypothetical protein RI894_1040 [Bacteroidota bacterium]|jgi:hypothetical protein
MKKLTFREAELNTLDEVFGLRQVWECALLDDWLNGEPNISEIDRAQIKKYQHRLIRGGRSWNEVELENKFISPLILTADIETDEIGYFLERPLSAIINDCELSGIVDGMIATGFRSPILPIFCLHEYKRSSDNQGSPDAQVLAAMLVAREKNNNEHPIYGLFVVGMVWNFVILNENDYCISRDYTASDDDIYQIVHIMHKLQAITTNYTASKN